MTPQEFTLCKEVVQYLSSTELTAKNYLFLEPVETSEFPTYLSDIKRPMDLGTVSTLLNSSPQTSTYQTVDQLFADILLCFENAVTFHTDKPENKWIVKLAKDMIRVTQREQKKMMKKLEGANEPGTMKSSASLPSMEDGEVKSIEVEAHEVSTGGDSSSNRKGKNVSVVKTNKNQRQAKFKITLPLSKNAPTTKVLESTVAEGMEATKISTQTTQGKQMLTDTTPVAPMATSATVISQPPPPKIRLNLGAGGGGKKAPSVQATKQTPNLNTTQTSLEVADRGSDPSVLEQTGRLSSNPTLNPKTLKKLPLQSKSSEPASYNTQSSSIDSTFSVGIDIHHVDALFATTASFTVFSVSMTREPREQAYKVLAALVRRNSAHAHWFLKPVNDPRLVEDYKAKYVTDTTMDIFFFCCNLTNMNNVDLLANSNILGYPIPWILELLEPSK